MLTRRSALTGLASALGALALTKTARGDEAKIPALRMVFHVTRQEDHGVADDAWIDAQVAAAQSIYAPLGVEVRTHAKKPQERALAKMETRADRDSLAAFLERGVINVFVVASLKDVDEKDRMRSGVHWHVAKEPAKHYIILAATAPRWVFTHELGHFFGNAHSTVKNNVMSYDHDAGVTPFFDDAQARTIRATAWRYVRWRELVP